MSKAPPRGVTNRLPQPISVVWAQRLQMLARWSGGLVAAQGLLLLVGWAAGMKLLPDQLVLAPNTYAGFILAGSALLLLSGPWELGRWPQRLASLVAVPVLLLGLLTIVEYMATINVGIDDLLLPANLATSTTPFPGRLSPNTALTFLLIGCAVILIGRRLSFAIALGQLLALLAALNGLRTVFGHAYHIPEINALTNTSASATQAAMLFMVLGIGVLCARPDRAAMQVVTSAGPGGTIARYLLPGGVVLPLLVGSLTMRGEQAGLFGIGLFMVLLTLLNVLIFGALAHFLDRSDGARARAEEATRRSLRRVQALHAIDHAILTSHDLQQTLDVVLTQVLHEYGGVGGAVLLPDPDSNELYYCALRGETGDLCLGSRTHRHSPATRVAATCLRLRLDHPHPTLAALPPHDPIDDLVVYEGVPLITHDQLVGVLEVYHHTPPPDEASHHAFLGTLAGQAAIAIDYATLLNNLQRANAELVEAYDRTLEGWARALELRDRETEGHARRVTELALRFAQELGLSGDDLQQIRRGAVLHDIGKLGVPDAILHKPGPLDDHEWPIMRRHPIYAYEWLRPISYLRDALIIPYLHHEKWDGSGYPLGLRGEHIPLAARLFAIVDVWDALTSDRPYRTAWPIEKARNHLLRYAGSHFDPQLVQVFLTLDPDHTSEPQRSRAVGEC